MRAAASMPAAHAQVAEAALGEKPEAWQTGAGNGAGRMVLACSGARSAALVTTDQSASRQGRTATATCRALAFIQPAGKPETGQPDKVFHIRGFVASILHQPGHCHDKLGLAVYSAADQRH